MGHMAGVQERGHCRTEEHPQRVDTRRFRIQKFKRRRRHLAGKNGRPRLWGKAATLAPKKPRVKCTKTVGGQSTVV